MAIHWPAGVGKDDSYVMYREGSNNYAANKGLDVSGDGTVTRGEALQRVRQSAGSGGRGGQVNPDERITTTELPPVTTEDTTSGPVSTPVVSGQGAAPVEGVQATADLPEEAAQRTDEEAPAARPVASRPTTPPEIQNLLRKFRAGQPTEEEIKEIEDYLESVGG
jgi:hypothetical protein